LLVGPHVITASLWRYAKDVAQIRLKLGKKSKGRLGRRQALDKGEVRPTPAFRLLRVGAELCVIE